MSYTLVPSELIVDGAITSAKLDTNISISGTLGVTGELTLATHLNMGDNDKIKIGTGGDLEIYHDGSNSYIANSTGNIYIADTNGAVHIQAKLNEESIVAAADGAVTLYHDNSAKLATASGGVTVTGELDATSLDISGDADIDGTLETDNLTINGQQGSDGQVLTSTGSGVGWENVTQTTINNNANNRVITGSGTANTLEGEANFVFDASNSRVGIGTTSPSTKLHLGGTAPLDSIIRQDSTVSGTNWEIGERVAGKWQIFEDDGDSIVATFMSSGNVGIGTDSPSQKFEVFPDDDHAAIIGRARVGNVGYSDFAGFAHLDAGDEYAILQQNNGHTYINAASGEDISFRISNADKMQLLSNGRVVIGTGTSSNAGLLVSNADIRCTAAAVANDANSISMSQESVGGLINARGAHTSSRGTLSLHVSASNGGQGITALTCNSDGSVSKNSGSFKIDHPLESKKDTHYLVHSFVEAPQADNIYRGVVQLENGTATINLDTVAGMTEGTFVALNTNTSCFTSNETDWDSVKGSISGNILTINCQNTSSTANVSWLVIGERHDQHMLDNDWTDDNGKVIVEPSK